MDFGVLDGLVSSETHNKNTLISSSDLDLKHKWSVSASGTHEAEWRDLIMAKIGEDDISKAMLLQQQRSNDAQNMLSFSSPNTQTVTFPYYATNNTGYGAGGPFTPSQWMELEHQALIYKYITANATVPYNLLFPIKKAIETAAFSAYSGANLRQNSVGWGALHLGFCNSSDPEPGRCRRTDGKKWRCAKDAVADQKYCERHMNRGRHRSRKPVEAQTCHSVPANSTAAKVNTDATVLRHTGTQPGSRDNRDVPSMKANGVPVPIALKKNQSPEFGVVCSDSLLNPMHKSDPKSQNPRHQFMEDWPHLNRPTGERLDISRLRIGLGGPLGEVLQHNCPSALRLMTQGWGN